MRFFRLVLVAVAVIAMAISVIVRYDILPIPVITPILANSEFELSLFALALVLVAYVVRLRSTT